MTRPAEVWMRRLSTEPGGLRGYLLEDAVGEGDRDGDGVGADLVSHLTFFFLAAALVRFSPSHTAGRRFYDDRRGGLLHGLPCQQVRNWA